MCRGLLGKKIGMMGTFAPDGRAVPVTAVQVGPCVITQIKTAEKEGYNALQVGFGDRKPKNINKPLKGHYAKSGGGNFAVLREFDVKDPSEYEVGQVMTAELFKVGDKVNVSGNIKGRGFSGVIKRHGFGGGKDTHGSRSHRVPGSIGCSAWPGKVIKGKKMPGQYGNNRKTVRNLEIVDIRPEDNLILIKGAVPGSRNGIVEIQFPKTIG